MNLRIQRPINWISYSVNEQNINTDWLSKEEIISQIKQAKEYWDIIEQTFSESLWVTDVQTVLEFNELKKVLEKVQTTSEQKSVLLEAMRDVLWLEQYEDIKNKVISSDHFKKITLHSNKD